MESGVEDTWLDSRIQKAEAEVDGLQAKIDSLTKQVNATLAELYQQDATGFANFYGDNRRQALEDLKTYTDQLMNSMEELEDLIDDIKDSIYDVIDAAQDAFDDQQENYEFIAELLQHDIDLIQSLYGDKAYDAMLKFYDQAKANNLQELDFLKKEKDLWWSRITLQQQAMKNLDPSAQAYKDAEKRLQEYKEHWKNFKKLMNLKRLLYDHIDTL